MYCMSTCCSDQDLQVAEIQHLTKAYLRLKKNFIYLKGKLFIPW